jgi:hypothetical protein
VTTHCEDTADDSVWAVTCFVTRKGGITYALAGATVASHPGPRRAVMRIDFAN